MEHRAWAWMMVRAPNFPTGLEHTLDESVGAASQRELHPPSHPEAGTVGLLGFGSCDSWILSFWQACRTRPFRSDSEFNVQREFGR